MLFEDNLGFIHYNFKELKEDKTDLTNLEEGFNRGNMFADLYVPYKNYPVFKVVANTEKEELLKEIITLSFAINDLELYLDLHPQDEDVLCKFRKLVEVSVQKEMEYVKKYGPIEAMDNDSKKEFTWIKNPWPWENTGGINYV